MAQVDLLWMEEEELRAVCVALVNLLRESEVRRLVCMNEALKHGYREGYTDAALQLPAAVEKRDGEGFVLH